MQSDKQYLMKLYEDILQDAAKHHLFVDFHGATIPRGWARTYLNLLTMEGIRGAEQYWDTNFAENAHMFQTIYPFTRNVVGSMDYTPIAGLNGEVKTKTVSVPLSFLGEGNYECLLITDGKVPRSFAGKTLKVGRDTVLSVNMAERGGFAARIRLKK